MNSGEPDALKGARPVLRGGVGKVPFEVTRQHPYPTRIFSGAWAGLMPHFVRQR